VTSKPFKFVFTSLRLVTSSDKGDSSASALTPLPAGHRLTTELNRQSQSQSQNYFTTGYLLESVRLGAKNLETHDQCYFFQLNICGYSPYVCNILSDERMGLSFTITAGPRQRSHSQVQVTRDS
jgi:hypothetical protein